MVKSLPAVQENRVQSLGLEDPLEKETATHSIFLPGESHGQRNLVAIVHGVQQSDTTEHARPVSARGSRQPASIPTARRFTETRSSTKLIPGTKKAGDLWP